MTNNSTDRTVSGTTVNASAATVANAGGMDMRVHQPSMDKPVAEDVRLVERNDREYLVFPLIIAREMVLEYPEESPPTREYLSAERLRESKELWAGTPLTFVHPNNPRKTAADPFAFTSYNIGEGHDPEIVGDNDDKLRVHGWLDIEKAESIGDLASDVVAGLRNGDELSVSAGYVTLNDRFVSGSFNGEAYDVEQGILIPDHIAIFPSDEFLARCTPEDGCAAPRANAVLEQPSTPATEADMTDPTNEQDIDPTQLRVCDHISPALAPRLNAQQEDVEASIRTLAGEVSDRDALARVVSNAYDLSETDVLTVLERAEAGDITVNASTLSKLMGAAPSASVDPSALRENASPCDCGTTTNAEGGVTDTESETPPDAATTDTPDGPTAPEADSETDDEDEPGDVTDTESDADTDTDADTDPADSETEPAEGAEGGDEQTPSDEEAESTDADTDADADTTMPETLSVEQLAANSAYGLDELQGWDEDQLAALEMTILTNNPALAEESEGGESDSETNMDGSDHDKGEDYSEDKSNAGGEPVTREEFSEMKAMVEDALSQKNNAEKRQKARAVSNAVEGLSEDAAASLDDEALDSLAEKHNAPSAVTGNYSAVAGPVDRQPQGAGPSDEDLADMPAGGRSDWEARQAGGD